MVRPTPPRHGWTFEEIVDENPAEPGQLRSRLDYLLNTGSVSPDALCRLSDLLEERGPETVGVLFQLPFSVRLESEWVDLPTSPDSGRANVTFTPAIIRLEESGRFDLILDSGGVEDHGWRMTQGFALFHVWGKRQRPHVRYLNTLEFHHRWNHVVVPQRESWVDNRPMTARDYEVNFARRLRIEVGAMLRQFLPAYTLASRSEAPVPRWTYGFVPMLSPGRVTHTSTIPVARYLFDQRTFPLQPAVSSEHLALALEHPHREIGRFESQLFALERLRQQGETELAIIGTAALLEWLLKTRTSETRRGARLVDLVARQRELGLPSDLIVLADEVRVARNALVHGAPPERTSIKREDPYGRPGSVLPGAISSERTRDYIEAAFQIFRQLNFARDKAVQTD